MPSRSNRWQSASTALGQREVDFVRKLMNPNPDRIATIGNFQSVLRLARDKGAEIEVGGKKVAPKLMLNGKDGTTLLINAGLMEGDRTMPAGVKKEDPLKFVMLQNGAEILVQGTTAQAVTFGADRIRDLQHVSKRLAEDRRPLPGCGRRDVEDAIWMAQGHHAEARGRTTL